MHVSESPDADLTLRSLTHSLTLAVTDIHNASRDPSDGVERHRGLVLDKQPACIEHLITTEAGRDRSRRRETSSAALDSVLQSRIVAKGALTNRLASLPQSGDTAMQHEGRNCRVHRGMSETCMGE